ncbi:MAG: hypothetical protein ACRD0D_11390, partial [Acidimicrobiales bacterium]
AQVLGVLVGEINLAALDAYRGLAVHAGVVARGSHAVAFPGASGAGKSTLAAACLLAGFDYVSDEALCIDYASSAVVPYAKPLKLSAAALRLIGAPAEIVAGGRDEVEVVASQLSAVASAAPLHLAEVVRLSRSPGPPRLERLPSAQVVTSLLQFSFNHFKQPGQAFELSTRLAHSCRAWDLVYADPGDAARLLWDSLRESPGR